MAHIVADRCRETSTTSSTGTYNLAGPVTGFQADGFDSVMASADTVFYFAEGGADWEVGLGTFTSGAPDTLARTTIYASSNAGAAVSWPASGSRNIVGGMPARFAELLNTIEIAVASAATTDIGALQGMRIAMSLGTGPVTSFGTATHKLRVVRYTGAVVLTCNTTSLVLLQLANGVTRTMAAGDVGIYASDGSGNWYELTISYASSAAQRRAFRGTTRAIAGTDTIIASDHGLTLLCTTTFTLSLAAAATLGDQFECTVVNWGTGVVTLDPNGAETINDLLGDKATLKLYPGERCRIVCNGTKFAAIGLNSRVLLETLTAAASATLDFLRFDPDRFTDYEFVASRIVPANDNVTLNLRLDADAGASFDAAAYMYSKVTTSATTAAAITSESDAEVPLSGNLGNGPNEGVGFVRLLVVPRTGRTGLLWQEIARQSTPVTQHHAGGGYLAILANAARFLCSAGNMASGEISHYGLR